MRNGNDAEMYRAMSEQTLSQAVAVVRTTVLPEDTARAVAEAAHSIDPLLSPQVELVKDAFHEKVGLSGKIAAMISAMGMLALLLAMVGLYGVVAYNVS